MAKTNTEPKSKAKVFVAKNTVASIGEELEDEIFHQHNVYEKLIAQTKKAKPSLHWRSELDEL